MKCLLKRNTHIEIVKRWATVGKQDINRGIYLGFLRHIEETPCPTYKTINTTLLDVAETSQRGEAIVDLLIKEGLVAVANDSIADKLTLTDVGQTALENKTMIEPSEGEYSFSIINDHLYPQMIISYSPEKRKFDKKDKLNSKQKKGKAIPWLKMPEFPVSSNGRRLDYTHPKQYFLPGKKNEVLYLYSIDELGEEPERSKENAAISVIVEPHIETRVEIDTKNGRFPVENSPGKKLTCEEILQSLNNLPDNLTFLYDSDELVSISSFDELNDDEIKNGIVSYPLSNVSLPGYGIFDVCILMDIKVLVDSEEAILAWTFHRVLDQIDHYITPAEYEHLQKNAAQWCSEHTMPSLNMDANMIQTRLPTYSTLTKLLQENIPESETDELLSVYKRGVEKILLNKPALRWYVLVPSLLTMPKGDDVNAA